MLAKQSSAAWTVQSRQWSLRHAPARAATRSGAARAGTRSATRSFAGRHDARPVERCAAAPNRDAHDRAGDRLVVAIADFNDGCDGGLLLDDVDGVFTRDDDDLETSLGGGGC
jgi:hypothetical protein